MKPLFAALALLMAFPALAQHAADHAGHADRERQAEVARRGADVMPFDLAATVHVFTKQEDGGTQRVVARDKSDDTQVKLVREHLRAIRAQFQNGDFSGPSHIHGSDMPGVAALASARPGQISIAYREVEGGAELGYRAKDPALVKALHRWFDAQLSDHGADAMEGHQHHHMQ